MHACLVLQKVLRPVIARLDARNARNLLLAVEALLLGRRLTLMELARHWPGAERICALRKGDGVKGVSYNFLGSPEGIIHDPLARARIPVHTLKGQSSFGCDARLRLRGLKNKLTHAALT